MDQLMDWKIIFNAISDPAMILDLEQRNH